MICFSAKKMKGTEVPNPRRSSACDCTCVLTRIDHCLVNYRSCRACQMCSVFVLTCAKSAHVFQKLSYSLCGLCLSLSPLITLPQTVRLFYVSLRSQAPQQQYTVLSFSSMRRHGQSQTDLFTCTTVLHCAHTFLRRIDLLHSIACTTVLHCGHTSLNLS